MKSRNMPVITIVASLAALGGMALAAQDKYTVQVPNGLALSECRGYDDWPAVAVSHPDSTMGASEEPDDKLTVIVANPAMIDALPGRHPRQRQAFPRRLQDCEDLVDPETACGGPLCREGAGHPGRRWLHGEG